MKLRHYGLPSVDVVRAGLQGELVQAEKMCRDWSATGNRQSVSALLKVLGGLALLGRLYRLSRLEAVTRQALRLLCDRPDGQRREVVAQCLRVFLYWNGALEPGRSALAYLGPLRSRVLEELRELDGEASPTDMARQYLALRDVLAGRKGKQDAVPTAARLCTILLVEESARCRPDEPLVVDVALRLDPLLAEVEACRNSGTPPRQALYAVVRELSVLYAAARLRCIDVPIPALRQALWLLFLLLRHHVGDWPADSLSVLMRQLLAVQYRLRPMPRGAAPDIRPVMRHTGCFLRTWRSAVAFSPTGGQEIPEPINEARIRDELRLDLQVLMRGVSAGGSGRDPAAVCSSLSKLHLNLHSLGRLTMAWWADSLQHAMLALLQSGTRGGPVWQSHLSGFRMRILPLPGRCAGLENGTEPLLAAVEEEAWRMTAVAVGPRTTGSQAGVAESAGCPGAGIPVIDQLSGGMNLLPDPALFFQRLTACESAHERGELIRAVRNELFVLEKGARLLGVPRIEALATVLATVYSGLDGDGGIPGDSGPDRSLLVALQRGHAGLLYRLDQAAAWQTVSRPQPVIEFLYRFMERRQKGPSGTGLAPPQRCLAINRRLQSLLQSLWTDAITKERRTLILTLMRDQARLLREMSEEVVNNGQP